MSRRVPLYGLRDEGVWDIVLYRGKRDLPPRRDIGEREEVVRLYPADEVAEVLRERDEASAEVERLTAALRAEEECCCDGCEWHNPSEQGAAMRRSVAERQREGTKQAALVFLVNRMHSVFRDDFIAACDTVPLVTDEEKS